MSSVSDTFDTEVRLTVVNRPPYRPATPREPVLAYSLLKRTGITSASLHPTELDQLGQLKDTRFFDFLREKGYAKADGNTRGIIQTVWGNEVVSYVYTGLLREGDTTRDVGMAPQALLEGFMDGLRPTSETSQSGSSQIFVPYYAKRVSQRMVWLYMEPDGQTAVSRSDWATVVLTHGKESCSPFCPTPPSVVGQTTMMPKEDHLCAERDLSQAAWLWYMEADVMKERQEG